MQYVKDDEPRNFYYNSNVQKCKFDFVFIVENTVLSQSLVTHHI